MTSQTPEERPNIEEEYTSHEALKEWEKEKDQNNLTQNIVALLGIHGMHCKFYEYQNASHITKAFEDLFHQQLQKDRQHILAVLREGANKIEMVKVDSEGWELIRRADVKALLQETLGEGKEINSIFKE